jgi:hypothetical protein
VGGRGIGPGRFFHAIVLGDPDDGNRVGKIRMVDPGTMDQETFAL